MKLKMLVSMAGANFAVGPGDTYEATEGEARRMIDAGYAIPVAEDMIERAVPEKATRERRKKASAED